MKKKWFIVIGILVVVFFIACAVIGAGESIYRASNGQRGWSMGAAAYNALGWGTDAYLADSAQRMQHRLGISSQTENKSGETPDAAQNNSLPYGAGSHLRQTDRRGHGGFFLLVLIALGAGAFFFYRRKKQSAAAANPTA